ncbi:hypothetical protein GBAR_LOCUS29741 [Geodia barretti]|uniref:Uncharacterized protein n=1 Tax=Geodia barretti TaxID=519541 RepID=A0AA35XD97_GEOBA|nr:hypothetical protein GBAR_LOCUS29741 [Geodia barretti]
MLFLQLPQQKTSRALGKWRVEGAVSFCDGSTSEGRVVKGNGVGYLETMTSDPAIEGSSVDPPPPLPQQDSPTHQTTTGRPR